MKEPTDPITLFHMVNAVVSQWDVQSLNFEDMALEGGLSRRRMFVPQTNRTVCLVEYEVLTDTIKRLVAYNPDGKLKGVRYQEITAVLVKAIQEQQQQIDDLRDQLHLAPHRCNAFCKAREFFEGL